MADRIVGEYSIKVDEAVKNLDKIAGRVGKLEDANKKAAKNTESEYTKMVNGLTGQFKNLAGAIGIAFGTQQLISFAKEAITVAAKAEGIERAFRKLNNPNLLNDLRKATRGTVSDIELMQKAVQANNFNLPLDQLAKLFQFATNRAIETGESVDYLVESIVLGISRKSIPIMDNLGISSVRLQKEMEKTGDFAQAAFNIIAEESASAGIVMDTTSVKLARLQSSFSNFTKEVGDGLIVLADFALKLDDINNAAIGGEETLKEYSDKTISAAVAAAKLQAATGEEIGFIQALRIQLFGLTSEEEALIESYEKKSKVVDDANDLTQEQIKNVAYYKAEISKLTAEQEAETTTLERNYEINKELAVAREELARLLGKETDAVKKANEEWEKFLKTLRDIDADDPFAGQLLKGEQEVDILSQSLNEAFGTEGTERIQMFWDEFMRSALEALDEVDSKNEETFDNLGGFLETTLQSWASVTNTVAQLTEAQYNRQFQALENQLRREQISREEYDRRRAALAREQFQKQKEFSIVQAVINTALGVTNAFATAPNIILGAVLAAVVAAAGAAEIATISSQPVPQFAEGGWVDNFGQFHGRKHAQGGITIEAEGGEFITSAKYAKPNAEILKAINSGNWEQYKVENIIAPAIEEVMKGGFEGMGASYQLNSMFNDKNLLKAIDRTNRTEREVGEYIVRGIGKQLRSNQRDRYV